MREHLIFYDGECGLCDQVVQTLLRLDTKERFVFAPLQGQTAEKFLQDAHRSLDTMILIENYATTPRIHLQAGAVLRILFLLGGLYTIPGLLSFLPSAIFNPLYRLIARNRHRFFKPTSCTVPEPKQKGRFLL